MLMMVVAAGGALGSVLRYGISLAAAPLVQRLNFPAATLGINVAGSFFMGLLMAWLASQESQPEWLRPFFAVGVLGGFTTFSAFSFEALQLMQSGAMTPALVYILLSVMLGIAALWLGYRLAI